MSDRRSVYIRTDGGIGNVLLQVAHGLAFAASHGVSPKNVHVILQTRPYHQHPPTHLLQNFSLASKEPLGAYLMRDGTSRDTWGQGLLHVPWPDDACTAVVLHGDFACARLLTEVMPRFVQSLTFSARDVLAGHPDDVCPASIGTGCKLWNHSARVFVHVRRGDYVRLAWQFELLGPEYYTWCRDDLLASPQLASCFLHFICVSDDMHWCKEQPWLTDVFTVAGRSQLHFVPDTLDAGATLYCMSQCDHGVCANSTFSLWGGLMLQHRLRQPPFAADGLTGGGAPLLYAPDQWFNVATCDKFLHCDNMVPDSWIRVRWGNTLHVNHHTEHATAHTAIMSSECTGAVSISAGSAAVSNAIDPSLQQEFVWSMPPALSTAWVTCCAKFAAASPLELTALRKERAVFDVFDHVSVHDAAMYTALATSVLDGETLVTAVRALALWDVITGGVPAVAVAAGLPCVSTTATKYLGTLAKIAYLLGPLSAIKTVVEVGNALGGMAWMLSHLPHITRVVVFDLPEVAACTQNIVQSRPNITCMPAGSCSPLPAFDLVLSEHAWSQATPSVRAYYARTLFAISTRGLLTCNSIPSYVAMEDVEAVGQYPVYHSPNDVAVSAASFTVTWQRDGDGATERKEKAGSV